MRKRRQEGERGRSESEKEMKVKVHLNVDEKEKMRGRAWERWQRRGTGGRGQTGIDSNCAKVFLHFKRI